MARIASPRHGGSEMTKRERIQKFIRQHKMIIEALQVARRIGFTKDDDIAIKVMQALSGERIA
jgi:hypothetical protein